MKSAEALHTNENHPLKKLEELHQDSARTTPTKDPDPLRPNKASFEEFMHDNPELLNRAFDSFEATKRGDRSTLDKYFTSRTYESRSPSLRKYAEAGHLPTDATLSERVKNLLK